MLSVVLFTESVAHEDYYECNVKPLEEEGFHVHVVDCSPYTRRPTYESKSELISRRFEKYDAVFSLEDFSRIVDTMPRGSLAVSTMVYCKKTAAFYAAMRRRNICLVCIQFRTLPTLADLGLGKPLPRARRLKRAFGSWNKIKRTVALSRFVDAEVVGMQSARAVVINYKTFGRSVYPVGRTTEVVRAHSLDYERYRVGELAPEEPPYERQGDRPLAVFIESCAPYGPDSLHTSKCTVQTEEVYYPEILGFLNRVRDAGYEVCVAAHPKSPMKGRLEHFEQWPLILGKTRQMVKMADICLIHYSGAISYPVLYRKPVMFLTTDQINAGDDYDFLHACSWTLNKEPVNISGEYSLDLAGEMHVDEAAYQRFEDGYIRGHEGDGRSFWTIVADKLKEYARN